MRITQESFEDFLKCPRKSHLVSEGAVGPESEVQEWRRRSQEDYKEAASAHLRSSLEANEWHVGTPPLAPYPSSLAGAIQALESRMRAAPQEAATYAALGDLYLFEANWISKAIASYQKASALAPGNAAYHWRLMDLYMNASRADKMLEELRYLATQLPADAQTQEWYRYYKKEYDFGDD